MFPGTFAATTPDKPAVVRPATGEQITYAELEARSAQLAHLMADDWGLRPGDTIGRQPPPHARGVHVHRRRLRRPRPVRLRGGGRPRGQLAGRAAGCRAPGGVRRGGRGLRGLPHPARGAAHGGARRPAPRPRLPLLLRHHRPAQGRARGPAGGADRRGARPLHAGVLLPLRLRRRLGLPVPRPALPRGAAALLRRGQLRGRHGDPHGPLRPRGGPAAHRGVPGHALAVGAHDVRADAQAARRHAREVRPVEPHPRHPRRGPVPARGQAPDDRVVGAGDPRVLLGHRGHGHHLYQLPPRRRRPSSTPTIPPGRPSGTSATSTRTVSSI